LKNEKLKAEQGNAANERERWLVMTGDQEASLQLTESSSTCMGPCVFVVVVVPYKGQ
jgi:hypothetical protein